MNEKNIYLILLVVSIVFYILDFLIFKTYKTIETYENHENSNVRDLSFLKDVNNENLSINDFYPTELKNIKDDELLNFALEIDLFHNILPKFGGGYLGIINFNDKINGIYESSSLIKKDWKLLDNIYPDNMVKPIFLTYDKDKKLMCIFEDNSHNIGKYHLYKKESEDINSPWVFLEKSKMISIIYDNDEILVGLDIKGNIYKKESYLMSSKWNKIDNDVPMKKLLFNYNDEYMLGLSYDFQILKKKGNDWKKTKWSKETLPKSLTSLVRDFWFDYDGKIIGLSRVGLVKKESRNYLSKFIQFDTEVVENEISVYDVLYSITGIKTFASMNNIGNNSNNVYVDGKKISEYKFKDPKLNKYLNHSMNLKKQCRKMKALKLRNLENNKDEEKLRNKKFMNTLNDQNDAINELYNSITDLKDRHFNY